MLGRGSGREAGGGGGGVTGGMSEEKGNGRGVSVKGFGGKRMEDGRRVEALTFAELFAHVFGELRELALRFGSVSVDHEVLDKVALLKK